MKDNKLAVLRRIDAFARDFDPYSYDEERDMEITDEYLEENAESVIDFIREIVKEVDDYNLDEDEEETLLQIVGDLKSLEMWERKAS